MAIYAGALTEVTCSNPTEGSKTLYVMASEDMNLDSGGMRKEEDVAIDSSGQPVYDMNQKPWKVDGTFSNNFNGDGAAEYVNKLAASTAETDFTFSFPSGNVYAASGSVVGDIAASVKGTVPLIFSGGGKLAKIA
jgi:hypothetical protein